METRTSPERAGRFGKTLRKLGSLAMNIRPPYGPDFVMEDVHYLTPGMLAKASPETRVVVFGIGGTLERYKGTNVSGATKRMIRSLRQAGYVVAINSNAPDEDRAKEVHDMFDGIVETDLVITSYDAKQEGYRFAGKPAVSMLDITEKRIANSKYRTPWKRQSFLMVGDQYMKDVVSGKRAHTKTLLVNKYGPGDHEKVAKIQRPIERRYLQALGVRVLTGKSGQFRQFDLPDQMTSLSAYRRAQRA